MTGESLKRESLRQAVRQDSRASSANRASGPWNAKEQSPQTVTVRYDEAALTAD